MAVIANHIQLFYLNPSVAQMPSYLRDKMSKAYGNDLRLSSLMPANTHGRDCSLLVSGVGL